MGRPKKEVSARNIEQFQKELELAGNSSQLLLRDKKGRSRSCLLCRRRKQKCDHKLPSCTACLKASVKCIQPAKYNNVTVKKEETPTPISTPSSDPLENTIPTQQLVPPNIIASMQKPGPFLSVNSITPPTSLSTSPSTNTSISSAVSMPGNLNNDIPETNESYRVNSEQPNTKSSSTKPNKPAGKVTKKKKDTGKDQYTSFLERKLKFLEKLIDLPVGGTVFTKKLSQYKKITHLLGDIEDLEDTVANIQETNQDAELKTESSESPSRIPSQTSLDKKLPALSSDSLDPIDFHQCIFAKYFSKKYFPYDPAFEFDYELSKTFLETFFTRLQFKYPLLDEQEIYSFHDHYSRNNIYSYSTNEFHFASGRMWLVFSISAYMQKTTGKYKGLEPERYFSTAVRHITKCAENLNYVHRIELLTLLVLYLIRTDTDSLVLYKIMKDIMNICKNKLSLNQWFPNDPFSRKKLRLFWCVYLLERMICEAVGKPFTIRESEIDLPYFDEETFNGSDATQIRNVHFINQSLKLRRIESSFVEELKILPDNSKESVSTRYSQLPKVNDYFKQLEKWRASCSTNHVKNFENETLKLYYYRSVRLLIQPYLEFLKPEDRLFRECQAAAGQICQLYKIFHQKTVNGHSTPAVHTVFVAGVTLVYCMWLARNYDDDRRKKLGDASKHTRPAISASLFSTMDDLRACSVCLYVMTERSKFARVFRDTFDELMNATIGNLIERCGPDSSELIHLSKFKNNVENDRITLNSDKMGIQRSNSEQGQSSSDNDDAQQNPNGMPPARKRVFGVGQAEEHVGFVQNSQVDVEEQMIMKRKQDDLEKESLPKGLAHLLVNEREDNKAKNAKNIEKAKTLEQSKKVLPSQNTDENQLFAVKKPTFLNESDWQMFQQQAYVQQQLAQQNLQAYLSSLNYTPNNEMNTPNNNSTIHMANSNYAQNNGSGFQPEVQPPPQQNMMMSSSNIMLDNNVLISQMARSPTPNISNMRTTTPSAQANPEMYHENEEQRKSQLSVNSSLSSNNAISGVSVNGVLFNNGTHDMINNISNWTNDSVVNGVPIQYNGEQGIPQQPDQGMMYQTGNIGNQIASFPPQMPINQAPTQAVGMENTFQTNNVNSTVPTPMFMNNQMMNTITSNDANNINTSNGTSGQYHEGENKSSKDRAEEFWTVNDDYGFLT